MKYQVRPPTRSGVTNSPAVVMNTRTEPTMTAGYVKGSVTVKNVRQRLAPRSEAASNKVGSSFDSDANNGRIMKGSQTYMRVNTTRPPVAGAKFAVRNEENKPRRTEE